MINRVVLVGRLARDPELRKTQNNVSVVSFTVAVDNRMKSVDGQKTTSFIPCVAWNATADNVANYTKKGSLVGVDGRINQRSYKNNAGVNVQVVEVIADSVQFLGPKDNTSSSRRASEQIEDIQAEDNQIGDVSTEDDLPF